MRARLLVLLALAALVLLAYFPTLSQPLIEDDYPNLIWAQRFGPIAGWHALFADPVFRVRATTWWLMYGVHHLFGLHAAAYYSATILLQILNTWLVCAMGAWKPLGYRLSIFAAGFFAVYEGHQEAVMWLSGSTEPLLVFFGLLAFVCWMRFLSGRGLAWYAAALAAFCLALLSKESAVILAPLLALPIALDRSLSRKAAWLLPFFLLAAGAALSIFLTRYFSFRFQDGSFSLQAPFYKIWPLNFGRLLGIWGLLSLIVILLWKPGPFRKILFISLAWMALSLVPYSFLTYSVRIPSRQLHLASVGLAILVGFALQQVYERYWPARRVLVAAVCGAIVVANVAYLWTKKRSQFLERAAPTEQLIALARVTPGPIYVQCYPRVPVIAEAAVELMVPHRGEHGDLIWTEQEARARHAAATFCYSKR